MYKVLSFLLFAVSSVSQAQNFVTPLGGIPFKDWTIVNYVDLDNTDGVLDWNGGNYSYDGHNAIDFTLPHFAAMDAGVPVYAAGSGTVIHTHDGEFDRWSRVNPFPGGAANYVLIDHGNDIVTEYFHLKKNSIVVSAGDVVTQGQVIAQVGSSGYSSDAHLHFTVYQNGSEVETFLNPSYWWQSPLPYPGSVDGVLDQGVTDHYPSTAELVEKPAEVAQFDLQNGAGQLVVSWSNLHWNNTTDALEYFFIDPVGTVARHFTFYPSQIRYGWWNVGATLPSNAIPGTWTIRAMVNSTVWFERNFTVIDGSLACNGLAITVNLAGGESPTSGDDVILGTSGNDTILAQGGNDTICGLGGDDNINGGRGEDWIDAGEGNDTVQGANDDDEIYGGTGLDTLYGGPGSDTIHGEEGDDNINGNSGNDMLYGNEGVDRISGGSGNDTIYTGTGSNIGTTQFVTGGNGNDSMYGGTDADVIRGEAGDDTIKGGAGNDRLYGGGGEDDIDGESGDDLVRGNAADDVLKGGDGDDQVDGLGGRDMMYGGVGSDTLNGSTGDDAMFGGSGNDFLNGGGGNDALHGGSGTDACNGAGGTGDSSSACEVESNIP